ncbi:MAG: apolipoprotein N-acyltransferase [Verrucomicrobiales bacterium]|jgi:apolipoprotein N-acyltransferase
MCADKDEHPPCQSAASSTIWTKAYPWLLILLAPLPAILAFEPYGFWWLAPLAYSMLFAGFLGMTPRMAFIGGFVSATLMFAGTLLWLWNLFDMMAIVLWMILASFTAVFGYFFRAGGLLFGQNWRTTLAAATVWTGIEYFRCEAFILKLSWITPGTALPPGWLSPIVGTYGVTFVLVTCAIALTQRSQRVVGAIILGLLCATVLIPRQANEGDHKSIRVVAVQNEGGAFKHHLEQTVSVPRDIDLIVWPEHAVPYNLMEQERQLGELQAFLRERNAIAVIGTRRMDENREAPDGSAAWFNMACVFSADTILGYHDKNHPVHFFNDGSPGATATPVDTPLGKIGTPVCFDVDFQDVVRKMTLAGAVTIVAPTMDSESWSARQHVQHAQLFRHRAAENGRWITVAATSGVTQIIDSRGQTRAVLPLMDKGVLDGEMLTQTTLTVFTRYGWMTGPMCMWLGAALVVLGFPLRWHILRKRKTVVAKRDRK